MVVIFLRTLIIFTTLIIVMRLLGKRQIGEMQPFEFVITLIIADLACVPMSDVSIPLVYGIVSILALFILHTVLSFLEGKGKILKLMISGRPSIVINKDGVDLKELKKNDMEVPDLIESMRAMGYFSLDDLDYAIFESNGKLSALKKEKSECEVKGLPYLIISDGKPVNENLLKANLTVKDLNDFLSSNGGKIKNTEVMTLDENGRVYLKEKRQKYKILNTNKAIRV